MGVFNTKKKIARKTKRVIRKSLSGVCIASALLVALVPATPSQGYKEPGITGSKVSYDYGVQSTDSTLLKNYDTGLTKIVLDRYNNSAYTGYGYDGDESKLTKTYMVRQLTDGSFDYNWQFKVYEQLVNDAPYSVVCKYNDTYASGVVSIAANIPISYTIVENSFYDEYRAAMLQAKNERSEYADIELLDGTEYPGHDIANKAYFVMENIDSSKESVDSYDNYWIKNYFPDNYAAYKTQYNDYLSDLAKYNDYKNAVTDYDTKYTQHQDYLNDPEGKTDVTVPSTIPTPPVYSTSNSYSDSETVGTEAYGTRNTITVPKCPSITCYVSDMKDTADGLYKYFCMVHPSYNLRTSGDDYTLEKVKDSRGGTSSGLVNQYIYMVRGTPKRTFGSEFSNDDFGFRVEKKTSVIGIGAHAFDGTTNVTELLLAGEVKYIGDYAFYNSFVNKITFQNVQDIGNRAFKDCTKLVTVDITDTTVNIGTEAFYGCNMLSEIALPQSITYIGPGAFANCIKLTKVDLSAINQACNVSDFAFFNDIALSSVSLSDNIARIGEGCFACSMGVSGNLSSFKFPDHISVKVDEYNPNASTKTSRDPIGNFCLAGRTNLLHVTMPSDYGKNTKINLPYGVFYNCIGLLDVTFPDVGGACGYVEFDRYDLGIGEDGKQKYRTIFDTVQTGEFCVYGPESDLAGNIASPRKSTWGLKSGLGNDIPYIYTDSHGEQQVEISDGSYILIIDDAGVLQSCLFANNEMLDKAKTEGIKMVVPEYVGDTKVTGVSSSCFSDLDVKDNLTSLEISDNTLTSIAPEAFKGCKRLSEVIIGNSVSSIGASAFEGCNALTKVTFHTPTGGYSSFPVENLGVNAFSTGADELTFIGDIDEAYGPFIWATDPDNYVDEEKGTRVCYKTPNPTNLTVIVDNRNGYATLVDYPHYEQLNKLSNTVGSKNEITDASGNDIELFTSSDANPANSIANPFNDDLITRYENLGKELYDKDANVVYTYSISLAEEKLVNATLNLDVPSGIESIDVNGFMNNKSQVGEGYSEVASNSSNVSTYLVASDYYQTYRNLADYTGGLFKGYYGNITGSDGSREYPIDDPLELESIGNDRIRSLTLHTVEYLPDYAFYSCENLSNINLGSKLGKMGDAPFTGCTSLTGIGSQTDDFICSNGIVYSENPDGTYNIIEVLSARGKAVGSQKVRAGEEDPYLANVSTISPGAFENCDSITGVDFTGITLLKELPDNCFKDSDKLNQVILPDNITAIGHNAFAGCMEGVELVCYGKEVYLPADSFGREGDHDNEYVASKRVVSYKDSAVRKAARDIGADVSETLDDTVKVQFFDYDGTELSKIIYVNVGNSIKLEDIPKDPVREGYVFAGWNKPLTSFTEDSVIVATYKQDPNNKDSDKSGNDPSKKDDKKDDKKDSEKKNSGSSSGNNTSTKMYTLTVTNGNGSGSYAAGATVIITCTNPPSGQVFDKWVPTTDDLGIASVNVAATTLKMPAHEASVAATFKAAPTNTNGNKSNESGNNKGNGSSKTNGNTVLISKPGISNTSLASVSVTGSNDNYVVRIAETAAATAAVEKALTNEYGSLDTIRYSAMDITLYDATGTNKITNYSGLSVTITMPLPDVMTQYAGNNKVAGVVNEKLDKLNPKFTTIDGVPCVTFTATHFSPYTIYVDTGNISETTTIDGSPKTGDGISPKWFLVAGLTALGVALFFMKDKKAVSIA